MKSDALISSILFIQNFRFQSKSYIHDSEFSKVLWKSFDITRIIDARSLNGASLLLIISGISSVIISFMGLYGACRKDKCFLTTYCLLVCIILILEIAAVCFF